MNKKFFPIFGLIVFLYILVRFDANKILSILKNINTIYFAISILIFPISLFLQGLKWNNVLRLCSINYPFKKATILWYFGLSIGIFTPGRIGEITKSYYLHREGYPTDKVILSVILDRLIDIVSLSFLSIFSIFFALNYMGLNLSFWLIGIILIFIGIITFSKKEIVKVILKPFFSRFISPERKNDIRFSFNEFYNELYHIDKKALIPLFLISITTWFFYVFQAYVLSFSIDIKVSYTHLLVLMPLSVIAAILPISISGLGTREAIFVYFFSNIGIQPSAAVAFSLLVLAFNWLIGVFGVIVWIMFRNIFLESFKP